MQKYYNPRLHNAVVAGTGMEHPRRPHVVLGSELNGYVQGDLVDANGICDLIHEKNVDTYAKLEALETSLKNESKARVNSIDNLSEQIDRTIANKLGSTETVYGESIQRAAEDERLQLQINELNSKYTALGESLSALNTTVNGKQDTLVAGNNIKNISDGTNTVSLLGAGDVRFKTINGQSIIGSDDIEVSSGGCDCPYQVIIRIREAAGLLTVVPTPTPTPTLYVYDIIKGDYETTLSKLQMGEYIDMKVFFWDPNNKMEKFSTVEIVSTEVLTEDEVAITIDMGLNNPILVWTSEGITQADH